MINDSSSKDIARKEEENTNEGKIYRGPSSSRQWFGLRDPRVVRVSRTFGGKDRHSKVSTMRGLRDRRVRLSVPTAIQLYDLQDRLGFNQPSKVVDWLLNAAQDDIDKLPPLQIPPELFMHYPHSLLSYQDANPQQDTAISLLKSDSRELKDGEGHSFSVLHRKGVPLCDNNMVDHTRISQSDFVETKIKEGPREEEEEKKNWYKKIEEENESRRSEIQGRNQTSFSSILGTPFPFTSYHNWDPCNSYLSQLGNYGCAGQVSEHNKNSNMSLQPSIPFATSRSSLVLYPATTVPAIFHPTQDSDPKQVMMNSNAQNTLPNSVTTSLYSLNPRYDISRKNHET